MIGTISILIVFTIIIIIYFASCRYMSYYRNFVNIRYPKVKLSEYKHNLKNGDIVLFVNRVHLPSTSIFVNTLFSHVSMVVKIDGILMLSESIFGNFIDDEPYKDYLYTISIENFACNHYFSEKIISPIMFNCI